MYDTGIDARPSAMEDMTIFVVYRSISTPTVREAIWGIDNGAWDRMYYPHFDSAEYSRGLVALGPVAPTNHKIVGAGSIDQVYLQTTAYNGSYDSDLGTNSGPTDGSAVYFNGELQTTFTDSTSSNARATLRLGSDGDDGTYNGQIAEAIIYNRILTECELYEINNYLGNKYGQNFGGENYDESTTHLEDISGL